MHEMSASDQPLKRLTKIVCTMGPSSASGDRIRELLDVGLDVARVNLAHGGALQQLPLIRKLKEVRASVSGFGILLDIRGAQIRTGDVASPIPIQTGERVLFAGEHVKIPKGTKVIRVDYDGLPGDVRETETILIDSGEIAFAIRNVSKDGIVETEALQTGTIGSRRHVNLPGADIDLPTFTTKDWDDMAVAVAEEMDFIAISFVRSADDIAQVREFLKKNKSPIKIVAKIETRQAVKDIGSIIDAADGIMVARGDLGADVPFEDVPVIQDDIVSRSRNAGKPVIIATHMLESMIGHPLPTRAEVTDVAHAAMVGADATMLSGETAVGKYPRASVEAMDRILRATETHLRRFTTLPPVGVRTESESRAESAVTLAASLPASVIVVITKSGQSARDVAKFRPLVPIIAITDGKHVAGHLSLSYAVFPLVCPFEKEFEATVTNSLAAAVNEGLLRKGDSYVLLTGTQVNGGEVISVQTRKVE